MIAAIVILTGLAACIGLVLTATARRLASDDRAAVERINALLPQIQCGQCGYPGCRPYAQALLAGEADLNQCPPGGEATVGALAGLLERPARPLDPARRGLALRAVARIDEDVCVGCALCLPACPVDAIVGAPRYTHTVIAQECTGCELCLSPCPVACIHMEPLTSVN